MTAAEARDTYELPDDIYISLSKSPRWKSNRRKSLLWILFSRIVRMRDWRTYGKCVSCGRPIDHWRNGDAGHFIAVGACGDPSMVFNPRNVNLECAHCNAWDDTHLIGYTMRLDERYGKGTADGLYQEHQQHKHPIKDWGQSEYHKRILKALDTIKEMALP